MKTVCKENLCNACTACSTICPKNCIEVVTTISSSNAIIDVDKCINCNLCKTVCPQVCGVKKVEISEGYYMYSKVENIRKNSSSGGIASMLALDFFNNNNYVTGVVYNLEDKNFEMIVSNDKESINRYRGSKYIKADLKTIYREVIELLLNRKKVLFIGTPCQVAGILNLSRYKKCDEYLYTVDLICHGTPSHQVFNKFIQQYKLNDEQIERFNFRNHHVMQVSINQFISLEKYRVMDTYMIGFLNGLFYTENCYECQFASKERCSDITLGDAWGQKEVINGLSLVIVNSIKGKEMLDNIIENCYFEPANLSEDIKNNMQLSAPSIMPAKKRKKFIERFNSISFDKNISKLYLKLYLKQRIKELLYKEKE